MLELNNWLLDAYYPNVPLKIHHIESKEAPVGIFSPFPAVVPGSIYKDLQNAGKIADPYYEMNSLLCEWVKDRWWKYTTHFFISDEHREKKIVLALLGIDYKAHIYLNGKKIGEHEGMFVPLRLNISDFTVFNEENKIAVLLEAAPLEMGQTGFTELTDTQKARFTYKWDFCTRMVGMGLYDKALIEIFEGAELVNAFVRPVNNNGGWSILADFIVNCEDRDVRIAAALFYKGEFINEAVAEAEFGKAAICIDVPDPRLWYPNGHGEQNLYTLSVSVFTDGELTDKKEYCTGLRSLSYNRCDGADESALPYMVAVNNKHIYIKGVNLVPLDMMYGCVGEEDYRLVLSAARDANINLVRVWGGGIIETEIFYSLCDQYGIMVWQEFIQSSSGLNNTPSKKQHFLTLLRATAEHAVKSLRNHISLTYWSGGNELTDREGAPSTYEDENIAMLYSIVKEHDDRLMLPTSASGPLEFIDTDKPGQNHDVHGPWGYEGIEGHYTLYNNSDSMLHSEFGTPGMSGLASLGKFLSLKHLKPVLMKESAVWRHHGEWWDTLKRDSGIFGKFAPDELSNYIACSQFIQGEGIRYALEANRRRAFKNCGSIIWQFNEPWPNVSNTCVLEYYGGKKHAYYTMREAYRPINPNLSYSKLVYNKGDRFTGKAFISNDLSAFYGCLRVAVTDTKGIGLFSDIENTHAAENCTTSCMNINFEINCDKGFYIELNLVMEPGREELVSRYLLLVADDNGLCSRELAADFVKKYVAK